MPRVTRSKKAPPEDASKSTSLSETSSTALQPKSTNTLKRPFNEGTDKKGKRSISTGPKAKRSAVSRPTSATSKKPKVSEEKWDVEGVYTIKDVDKVTADLKRRYGTLDISSFSLKVFYTTCGSYLYVIFTFGELQGIIRLCPEEAIKSRSNKILTSAEFEQVCHLKDSQKPDPKTKRWVMRWRGRAGGMLLGKCVGGEIDNYYIGTFQRDIPSGKEDLCGMKMEFVFRYDDNIFLFHATKTGNLTEPAYPPWTLKKKWNDLWNSDWGSESEDSPSEAESTPPAKSFSKAKPVLKAQEDLGSPASTSSEQVFFTISELKALRAKAMADTAARGEIWVDKEEVPMAILRRPSPPPYQSIPGGKGFNKFIELPPDWSWDVTGHWEIKGSPRLWDCLGVDGETPLTMLFRVSNNPLHTRVRRQLWATFTFGKLLGTMRFSPKKGPVSNRPDTLKKFEQECVLQSGCWPGDSPQGQNEWYIRWRGRSSVFSSEDGSDQWQGESKFKKGESGKLIFESTFMHNFQPVLFTAERVRARTPSKKNETTVLTCWDSDKPESARRGRTYIVPANSNWPYS
ncbi:uncharacterized protein PAC_13286 [Phialocephala subalpina]|uniref:Uncharacterized protein n=1 Tax=Phialocephala subalpina TaxID=576137 RepID=A0A1L7XEB2_9HELO|nr:uncharacterized protein PAC_13286 [Phialocephala subalpina]